jgi:hypothetical protein
MEEEPRSIIQNCSISNEDIDVLKFSFSNSKVLVLECKVENTTKASIYIENNSQGQLDALVS